MRKKIDVFGTDYPTPDGTCIRDYIHVSDLVARAFRRAALICAPAANRSTFNCGYGRGFSVLEVIDTVKRVSGAISGSTLPHRGRAIRRGSWQPPTAHAAALGWTPRYDDLRPSSSHALQWEQKLRERDT